MREEKGGENGHGKRRSKFRRAVIENLDASASLFSTSCSFIELSCVCVYHKITALGRHRRSKIKNSEEKAQEKQCREMKLPQ
jgi:hypothetical protein